MGYHPMNCSFCARFFYSEMAWQSHLVQSAHQTRMKRKRDDWKNWSDTMKDCCVVIWGEVSPHSLLGYFSQGQNQIVNFFDSNQDDAAKIVQFKSEQMVSQLFYEVEQAPNIMIEGKRIRLMKAVDYLVDNSKDDNNSKEEVEFDNFLEKTHERPTPLLWREFIEIYSEVLSPGADFMYVFSILERTRKIVELVDPSAKLSLFRHYYMKEFIIYTLFSNSPPFMTSECIGHRQLAKQLKKFGMKVINCNLETDALTLLDVHSGIEFLLLCNPLQELEGVIIELQKFLFTFDPRGKAMLIMLLYWVRQYGLEFSFKQRVGIEEFQPIPEVLGLQWICIFYLCQKGYLPTPREVISRPVEESVKTVGINRRSRAGTWFPRDYDFVRDWRSNIMDMPEIGTDEFVLCVLEMLLGFLEFCNSIDFGKLVFNTIDAELIPCNEVVKGLGLQDDGNMLGSCFLVCEKLFESSIIEGMQLKLRDYLKFYNTSRFERKF